MLYRQGDVLISKSNLEAIPAEAEKQEEDKGRVILAYGEVTGHAHALDGKLASKYQWQGDTLIEVQDGAVLRHEEHTHFSIPPGIYNVIIQKEYHPEAVRQVLD